MCGIAAVIDLEGKQDVVPMTVQLLEGLQRRGEEGVGISWKRETVRRDALGVLKRSGRVQQVLTPQAISDACATSSVAIGHTRYGTNKEGGDDLCHPYHYPAQDGQSEFSFAFNGNEADTASLLSELQHADITPRFPGDTEIIGQSIVAELRSKTGMKMKEAMVHALGRLDGACNAMVLTANGKVFATRDRHGFHPLAYAENGSLIAIASEDSAIRTCWPEVKVHNVKAGEILQVSQQGISVEQMWEPKSSKCFFEHIYFADHRSRLDRRSVANARYECGRILASRDMHRPQSDIVVPVPESAKIAANGYADTRRLRRVDALLRNEDAGRTFIDPDDRVEKIRKKFDIDGSLVHGKSVILVDDSMVRGNTLKTNIVDAFRQAGAQEIHVRLASPPILAPCFYGIDFSTVSELIARKYHNMPLDEYDVLPPEVLQAIAKDIGVNSIAYLPVSAVSKAIGITREELCMACVTGEYPTDAGQRLYQLAHNNHINGH